MKRIKVWICLALAALLAGCAAAGEERASAYREGEPSVTVSITGPEDEELLAPARVGISEGCTVYDATAFAAREAGLALESGGQGTSVYVTAIGGKKAEGMSGWIFRVNGETADRGCGALQAADGDEIAWVFITDLNEFYASGE